MGIKFIKKTNEAFDPGNVVQKYSITAEVTIPDEDGGYETETCRYVPTAPDEEAAKRKFREWFDKRSDYPEGSTYKILKISPVRMYPRKSEAAYTAIRNPGQAAFLIDCGSPEKAKELNDAFYAVAFVDNEWQPNKAVLGGELVQGWNVGPYFTACVDPCDKAVKWCEEWLRNSDGAAPGIQGNSAGLESKENEELSPKMKQRLKLKSWQAATEKLKGFDEAGHTFLDMIDGERLITFFLPVEQKPTKEEGEKAAEKIFGDFEGYLNYGADYDEGDEDGGWLPYYGLTKEFLDLPEGEGLEVLSELSDVLYRVYTKGEGLSEDRRGADRYGHSVRRFTSKDLTDLDGEVISGNGDDAGADNKFGLAYLDPTSISAFSNDFIPSVRDRFLHDLAQMPVSKKSIEDLLRKHKLHKFGDPIGVRDFFPENGIAYLGTYASDGLPHKQLVLKWGPALKK